MYSPILRAMGKNQFFKYNEEYSYEKPQKAKR